MRSKRLFAMLLVFCLVVANLAPAASAVEAAEDSVVTTKQETTDVVDETKTTASPFENELVVSGEDTESQGVPTLKDNPILKAEVEQSNQIGSDNWQVTPADAPDTSLVLSEVPACIEELKKAAEVYAADEVVTAFVVMEDQPLADTHTSRSLVSASAEKQLIEKQDAAINSIEKTVLGGKKLDVRYQFTYLTNSFSVKTEFANLEKIASISGVKSVFIMPVYNPCTTASPNTASSGAMTGVNSVWENLGYTGEGMKIAVIDTGLDLDHPSFAADPATTDDSMTEVDIANVLEDLNAYARKSNITASDLYRSAKVPFAFNYVDANLTADHSMDEQGDHGTHVAGIAAANALDSTSVVGMAPDAQIIVMKVFGVNGGAYMDDIVAALEDAMTLECDVVNASLGSSAGFSSSNSELDLIYERLASQDIVACYSAGNDGTSSYGNMWGTNLNRTQNPDNAAVGSPSTWPNVMSIASAENAEVMTPYFTVGENTVFYMDPYAYYYALSDLVGQELEYVIVPGLGNVEDFYNAETGESLVEGKVAIVQRGTINFSAKVMNAEAAGAVAALIWNNVSEDIYNFGMQIQDEAGNYPGIPAALITLEDGQMMAEAETKVMAVSAELGARQANGGQISSFSSWGVSPDLRLLPDITGIGGNVYSCYDGGTYGLMSGTSMSSPQVAGVSALVMQYLKELYPNSPDGTIRELAEALLMSTADPIVSDDSGVEASPRQQGAGLVDAYEATTTKAYLTVGGERPKAELGDNANGAWTFSFEIHNFGTEDKTYTVSGSLLSEAVVSDGINYYMAGYDWALSGDVSFDKDTVTVPAGGRSNVTVTVTLSEDDKAMLNAYWENGSYVEGYVYLANEEGEVELNLPYLGFYGDWTEAPVFDTAYWYDNSFWDAPYYLPEGDEYWHVMWTNLGGTDFVLGFNPYSGAFTDENGNIVYDPANNVVSPNGDGVLDGIEEMYISLLRNAKTLTFTYTVDGEVVHEEVITNNSKTMYLSSYGQVVPWLYSWYGSGIYDFTDENGNVLPNGTEVLLTIDGKVDYGTGGNNTIEIPITVDTEVPELVNVYEVAVDDSAKYLVVAAEDNVEMAAMFLMNRSGTRIYATDYATTVTEDGTSIAYFDVTGLGTEFMVALCDYAANEVYYNVTYTTGGDNLPEMDTSKLYAYRVYDNYIYSDHMYGWVSLDKQTSSVTALTDDYMEYAAINAAEYVGGKVFAVDAVYNLVVLDPGLWDRQTICNLGVNVIDMTFDDSTDTMYVLSKQGSYTYLYSMDLLTGELTQLKSFGYYYYAPWAITDDDNGTIYAIKYNSANIFTLDENYDMVTVTDANGADVVVTNAEGANVAPSAHAQSIVYEDGKLYWAYLKSSYYSEESALITIDTTDWTSYASSYSALGYDANNELVEYYPTTELVGLMTLTETEYQFPESTEATQLLLDSSELLLMLGESAQLTASALPWNYDLTDVAWSSDDESVVTVNENGMVTTVGDGTATITAAHGDLTATCEITVVRIEGNLYAYNYYSADGYYGYMIDVDLQTMDYYLLSDSMSPVDFYAGDYNGHDGYFYGYDVGGQLYRYDFSDNSATPIGAAMGTYPVDMAYDYSTGLMYVLVTNYSTFESTLYAVNLNNGMLQEMGVGAGLLTLACDTEGNLYTVDMSGYLCSLSVVDYSDYGMGLYLETMPIMEESFGEMYMLQSMCYDHNNDVILWACCDATTVYWVDVNAETPYAVSLGDPTESGVMEFVGTFVIPNEIPELPEVAVESVTAEDMMILTGYEKVPAVTVAPFNATCQDLVLTSDNTDVVAVTESGNLMGVSAGTASVTAKLEDAVSGESFEVTFNVTVMEGADNMYAHLLTDVTTMDAQLWIEMYPGNPGTYDALGYFYYTIFTQEYYNGKLYTYGYDAADWEGNWQFFVLDAETYEVETMLDMGESFPYVYDMTYDYNTSTMYVLAGASEDETNLYVADMETGKLILLLETEQQFMSLAAGPDGVLYAMEQSGEEFDWDTWTSTYTNANLYTIDPLTCTVTLVGDTGMVSNMIASMAYDYDTDALYWTPFAQTTSYISNLAIVDTETGVATSLGTIGSAGAQVGGLYILCDNFPEEDNTVLHNLMMANSKISMFVGDTTAVTAVTMPMNLEADIVWSSSDESVATVDAEGNVTGIAQGRATITASVTVGDMVKTATCTVSVLEADASFLTYNVTDGGWAEVSRTDTTVVTNLTEGEEVPVMAFTSVGTDVYGYDENNQLFQLNTETYERTNIGDVAAVEFPEGVECTLDIRDMTYDAANDRVLVLGAIMAWDPDWQEYSEIYDGCSVYSVDLTDGTLELVHTFTDEVYIFAMTTDLEGNIYYYETFSDTVNKLNPETGDSSTVISLQTQSIYGDYSCNYSMYYDDLTGTLFLLHSSNGRFYSMHTIDAVTGALAQGDYVGEVVLDGWYYIGDNFNGLTFVTEAAPAAPVYEAEIVGANVALNGSLRLSFMAELSNDMLANEDTCMKFHVNGTVQTVALSEAHTYVNGDETYYAFSIDLAAKQMADEVIAQVFVGDEAVGEARSYSVQQYAERKIAASDSSAELVNLVKAMLNYGAAAQVYFGYNTENLANANLDEADKVLPDVDASAYAFSITGAEDGISAKGACLEIAADTTIHVTFELTGDKAIDAYTFYVDGVEVAPVATNVEGQYRVDIPNIAAKDLDGMHVITVGGLTVEYGALSYVDRVINKAESSEELVNVAKALYVYNEAADTYFAN